MKYFIVSRQRTDDEYNLNDGCRSFLIASSEVSVMILKYLVHYSSSLPAVWSYRTPARGKFCLAVGWPGTDIKKKIVRKKNLLFYICLCTTDVTSLIFLLPAFTGKWIENATLIKAGPTQALCRCTPMSESAAPLGKTPATGKFIPGVDLHLCLKLSSNSVAAHHILK